MVAREATARTCLGILETTYFDRSRKAGSMLAEYRQQAEREFNEQAKAIQHVVLTGTVYKPLADKHRKG